MTTVQMASDTDTGASTRLTGIRLWAARLLWLLCVGVTVSFFVTLIPTYPRIFSRIVGSYNLLDFGRLSLEMYRLLGGIGLTPEHYSRFIIGIHIFTFVSSLILGLLIAIRRSDDWMSLLASLFIVAFGSTFSSMINAANSSVPESSLLVSGGAYVVALASFVMFMYLFPDGRFIPRWLIPIALINSLILVALFVQWIVLTPRLNAPGGFNLGFFFSIRQQANLPGGVVALYFLQLVGFGVGAQVYRYFRYSDDVQRQQAKWLVLGTGLVLLSFLLFVVPSMLLQDLMPPLVKNVGDILFLASLPAIPVTLGFSILRYRVWDVDFVINRTLVYGVMTVLLVGIFGFLFFAIRELLSTMLGGQADVIAAVIPAVVATALFNPVRRRLRSFIDKRFYGIHIDYATPAGRIPNTSHRQTHIGGYTDLHLIGSGGMGEVYRATHPELSRSVAIKVLSRRLAEEDAFRRRFEREAQVVTSLKHPNIVQMFEYGQDGDTTFMVMEFVEGRDLGNMIRTSRILPLEQVGAILAEIASALDYAHAQGIVHRDIKPSNVMMEPIRGTDGVHRAVLMDFGIAKIGGGATRLTASGMIGTLDYIAPEQIQGASDVDHRADIYALGVMTYQMLTGELPFKKNNPGALLMAHLMEPPPDACGLNTTLKHAVCAALQKAMAKKPADRYESAGAFVQALTH